MEETETRRKNTTRDLHFGCLGAVFWFWVIFTCMKEVDPITWEQKMRFGRNLEKTSFAACKVWPRHLDSCNVVKLIC